LGFSAPRYKVQGNMIVWELQKDMTGTYGDGLTSCTALHYKQYKQTKVSNCKSISHEELGT